ncbi:MAG TPA: hypothetical protein VGE02_15955 [Gemmatimonadales bacterium]
MYSTCIFCHSPLGVNESVEQFPVGRRLAFDGERGRLWVVCRRCERWNLTPLEERWEAVEECERLWRDTRRRVSTDNIGLARLDEGLELVRIGRPQRPEFAAWRYGDQFGRRRRRTIVTGAAAAATGAALIASGPLLGAAAGGIFTALTLVSNVYAVAWAKRSQLLLPHPEEGQLYLTLNQIHEVRILARGEGAGWALDLPYAAHRLPGDGLWQKIRKSTNLTVGRMVLEGAAAERAAGLLLPRINGAGASPSRVQDAVRLIEGAGGPERYFADAAGRTREWGREQLWGDTGALRFLPPPVRLALEMAAHEDAERAAMEGELALLEAAWRDAEEVAAIADDLLLPGTVTTRMEELRERG